MLPFDDTETVLLKVRKHWFVMIAPTVFAVFAALVPVGGYIAGAMTVPELKSVIDTYLSAALFAWFLWLLLWWMFWFLRWTDYYLDVWYITDKRIVDVEQRGVFHRIVSTLRYEKLQDITIEMRGIIPMIVGFGDIHVQTAGENREIIIQHAKHPERVKRLISEQVDGVINMSNQHERGMEGQISGE